MYVWGVHCLLSLLISFSAFASFAVRQTEKKERKKEAIECR